MYWRKFSSDPYSHHTLLLPRLVKTDFNQFNQAESSISRPTKSTETLIVQSLPQLQERCLEQKKKFLFPLLNFTPVFDGS